MGFFVGIYTLNVGLTVDAVGTLEEHETLIDVLHDFNIESTFFVRGDTPSNIINLIYDNGHEIGNHTYTHPVSLRSNY